jgi:hypothetical protein
MKLSILLFIFYIATESLLWIAVDALTPSSLTRSTQRTRPSFGLLFATDKDEQRTPFFLNDDKKTPTPPKTPPPNLSEPRPTISLTQLVNDETRENLEKVGDTLKKELVVCQKCRASLIIIHIFHSTLLSVYYDIRIHY